jgi:uncharacterized alpha/beta hydrolase family protein
LERKDEDRLYAFLRQEELNKPHLENVFPVLFVHGHAGEWQQGKHLAHVFAQKEFQVPDHMTVLSLSLSHEQACTHGGLV